MRKIITVSACLALTLGLAACTEPPGSADDVDLDAAAQSECTDEEITITQSTDGFLYFPSYVAERAGYYEDVGLEAKISDLGGGAEAIAAAIGGSADIAITSFPSVVLAADRGAPVLAFASLMTQYGSNVVINPKAAEAADIDEKSSTSEKIQALEGLTVGVTSPGSATDQLMRYMLASEDIDPDEDVDLLPMGDAGSIIAGYRQERLDAFSLSSPTSDLAVADGAVQLFNLSAGEYSELDGFQYMVAMTSTGVAKDRPEVLACFTEATSRALDLIQNEPRRAVKLARKAFGDIDPELYDAAAQGNIDAYPESPVIDMDKAQSAVDFLDAIEEGTDVDLDEVVDTELASTVEEAR